MADVTGALYIIVLILGLGITTIKLLNVVKQSGHLETKEKGKYYGLTIAFLLFAGYLVLWLLMLNIFMGTPTELLYITTYRLLTLLIPVNLILLIVELFYAINEKTQEIMIKPYKSTEHNGL